jgi:hypothetical protein
MHGTISLQSQKGVGSTFSFVALARRTNNIPPDIPGSSSTQVSGELDGNNR